MLTTFRQKRALSSKFVSLSPGYYLVRAAKGSSTLALEEDDESSQVCGEVTVPSGTSALLRLYLPTRVSANPIPLGNTVSEVSIANLPTAFAAILKGLNRERVSARIPLLFRSGYVCILGGRYKAEQLAKLHHDSLINRELVPLKLDDKSFVSNRFLDLPPSVWLESPTLPRSEATTGNARVAVVLHLFYVELWREIALFLQQVNLPFDLWVTHSGLKDAACQEILNLFPGTVFVETSNRGRDIWPFVSLLNSGKLSHYACVCKIHGKMSLHKNKGDETILGKRWRRRAFADLLAFGRAAHAFGLFASNENTGIIGPKAFRIPNSTYKAKFAWGSAKTIQSTKILAERLGYMLDEQSLDYFAGSMFWYRPQALEPLRTLGLQFYDFPSETGQLDGEVQHAIERLFTVSAKAAGFHVDDLDPVDFFPPAVHQRS